jgi:hypothetical protein
MGNARESGENRMRGRNGKEEESYKQLQQLQKLTTKYPNLGKKGLDWVSPT